MHSPLETAITYRRLAITHGGLFLLWGLAGMGKTTLARQFAYEIGPEKLTGFIRIGRRGLYEEDIRRILRTEGHDTSSWSDEHCQALFRTVARKFRTIRLLILDDPHSESDISALIPESSNVPVLVTSRGWQNQAVEACASTSSVNSSEGFFQL